ncbi:hypothetical protein R6Q59_021724 [Mikania micrantha]|uniref:Uncharacterized protein n=1 Tax=Mikania micrantha TaxID=192012 RepID=A0A5N6MWA0_9ASTR|nr:hypothetical protein E3N88_26765 [Mikania micrantha]
MQLYEEIFCDQSSSPLAYAAYPPHQQTMETTLAHEVSIGDKIRLFIRENASEPWFRRWENTVTLSEATLLCSSSSNLTVVITG